MRKLYSLILGLMLSATVATAQNCYEIVQLPYYPFPFMEGNNSGIVSDDIHGGVVPIGFDFCFFGNTYSEVVIASNGYIIFNSSVAGTGSPWNISQPSPDPGFPNNVIMAPWQDINPGTTFFNIAAINYHTYGIAPYRKFVVTYKNVSMYSCEQMTFSNQIVLYETLNIIDINIADKQLCTTWNNGVAIQGIENADGTEAYIVPGRNFPNQWTSTGDSYRFIPQCYCESPEWPDMGNVMGQVFWDYNQNCIREPGEPGIPNVRFDIQPNDGIVWSGYQGNIAFMADPQSFTMEHSPVNPWYLTNICPAAPVDITVYQDSTVGPYFWGDTIIPFQDLSVTIGSTAVATCFNTNAQLQVCNNGNIPAQEVTVQALLPGIFADPTSNHPFTQSGDTLEWLIDWMDPGECRTFTLLDSVPCDPALLNEVVCFHTWVSMFSTDTDPTNNAAQTCRTVTASYDPNDKQVRIAGLQDVPFAPEHYIAADHRMEYLIRFQNTGNAAAYNITIVDTLHATLDPQSVTPSASSHFYTAQLQGNVLTFHFPAIFLPDSASDPLGSQGWVQFTVSQQPGNPMGTVIPNAAAIYFDNNEPVITAPSYSIITGIVGMAEVELTISIVPNPANSEFRIIATDYHDMRVEVMDVNGRIILTESSYTGRSIDVSGLAKGIYPVRVTTPNGVSTGKLVRN